MKLYRDIFSQSWSITKKHVVLWWFGFFLLFWGGKGMDIELFFTNGRLLSDQLSPFNPSFWTSQHWRSFFGGISTTGIFVPLVILMLIFGAILLAMIIVSHIGLVDAFSRYRADRSTTYSLSYALKASKRTFRAVLAVNVLSKLFSYVLLAITALPLFTSLPAVLQVVYSSGLFILFMPVMIIISIITKYAVNAIVLEDCSVMKALHRGTELFSQNVGVSIELALLMFIFYFGVSAGAMMFAMVVTSPFFLFTVIANGTAQASTYIELYYVILYFAIVICMVLSAVIFSTWHIGNWTMMFIELTKEKKKSKLYRLIKGEK